MDGRPARQYRDTTTSAEMGVAPPPVFFEETPLFEAQADAEQFRGPPGEPV